MRTVSRASLYFSEREVWQPLGNTAE
jgi:integrase